MGKYNIPVDEIKDIKKELLNKSSNGDSGGVKEYYYKTTLPNNYTSDPIYSMVSELYVLGTRIGKVRGYNINNGLYVYVKVGPLTTKVNEVVAIQFIDMIDYVWSYMDWNDNHNVIGIPKGNIVDKVKYVAKEKGASQEELQSMIDMINSMFQEITKEEYEAMITYKPE